MESAYSFAGQWPYLRYLGMGAWWGWIWLCYNSVEMMRLFPVAEQPTYVRIMYLVSTLAIASAMFIAALSWRRSLTLVRRRGVVLVFSAIATVGTLALGYSSFLGGLPTFVVAAFLTGLGTSMLCLRCGEIYGSIAMRESLTAASVSLIFAAFLYFMGIGIPTSWRIVFIALLPLASGFLLVMPGDDPFPADDAQVATTTGRPAGRRTFRRLVIAAAVVALTAGVGKGLSSTMLDNQQFAFIGTVITFGIVVFAGIIIWVVNWGDIVHATRRVYSLMMLFGIIVLLTVFFGMDLSYMSIGKEVLWMVFSCFMAYMAFRFDMPSVRAFGFGQAAYFVTSTLGWAIGSMVPRFASVDYARMVICILFAFVIVLLLTFVFTDADIKFILTWRQDGPEGGHTSAFEGTADEAGAGLSEGGVRAGFSGGMATATEGAQTGSAPIDLDQATVHELVARIDPALGLSAREAEVLEMFAQGRSANWIADQLTVSKNTVRSHLRSIYVKLGVHTRQELLDFLRGPKE